MATQTPPAALPLSRLIKLSTCICIGCSIMLNYNWYNDEATS